MSAVFLNWCEISFDFYASKHGLDEVFEAVSSYVAECLGVILVIGQIFALDFAFIESFCSIIRFFVVSLFFKQFGLLGLNSKISLARTYLNQVVLVQVVVVVAVKWENVGCVRVFCLLDDVELESHHVIKNFSGFWAGHLVILTRWTINPQRRQVWWIWHKQTRLVFLDVSLRLRLHATVHGHISLKWHFSTGQRLTDLHLIWLQSSSRRLRFLVTRVRLAKCGLTVVWGLACDGHGEPNIWSVLGHGLGLGLGEEGVDCFGGGFFDVGRDWEGSLGRFRAHLLNY